MPRKDRSLRKPVVRARSACPQARPPIPFRSINRKGEPGYDPALQRHHLLPRQLLQRDCFGKMFAAIGRGEIGFDDFRANGLLLPASEEAAIRMAMPLHRGPHRDYNELVIERVGQIESSWAGERLGDPDAALEDALFRLALLRRALRKRLLDQHRRMILNSKDPLGSGFDFTELDAMAESLYQATERGE